MNATVDQAMLVQASPVPTLMNVSKRLTTAMPTLLVQIPSEVSLVHAIQALLSMQSVINVKISMNVSQMPMTVTLWPLVKIQWDLLTVHVIPTGMEMVMVSLVVPKTCAHYVMLVLLALTSSASVLLASTVTELIALDRHWSFQFKNHHRQLDEDKTHVRILIG